MHQWIVGKIGRNEGYHTMLHSATCRPQGLAYARGKRPPVVEAVRQERLYNGLIIYHTSCIYISITMAFPLQPVFFMHNLLYFD